MFQSYQLSYTNVPPAHIYLKKAKPPTVDSINLPPLITLNQHLQSAYDGLESVHMTNTFDGSHAVTWTVYHAKDVRSRSFSTSIVSMLPLLREEAHSISTLKHCLKHALK